MESQQRIQPWLERDWRNWQPNATSDQLLQALDQFPEQLTQCVANVDAALWTVQQNAHWSVQEHVGHLLAMESLWIARIDDFVMGNPVLRPWNGHNNDVAMAQFNRQKMRALLRDFAETRSGIVGFMREIGPSHQERNVRIERLDRTFSLWHHMAFMHEHDIHHLRIIQNLNQG